MKKRLSPFIYPLFCCSFLILLLFYSKECISLASNGLLIWYQNMIPSLFPFMVLSGFMVRSGLSLKIGQWMQPILGIFFRLPSQMIYAIFMGFLCGFPMGAKIVADMLEKKQITLKEGEYLLAFCNNIGPLYMLGYVVPLFGYKNIWQVLGLMYMIPLGYGLILRYFYFSASTHTSDHLSLSTYIKNKQIHSENSPLSNSELSASSYPHNISNSSNYLLCFHQALSSAIEQITLLGGCMIFFNALQIYPQILKQYFHANSTFTYVSFFSDILCSLIEIGGGLRQLSESVSMFKTSISLYLPLFLLTFGGLSCIAQTYFILKNTGLKISTYMKHKVIQSWLYILVFIIFSV